MWLVTEKLLGTEKLLAPEYVLANEKLLAAARTKGLPWLAESFEEVSSCTCQFSAFERPRLVVASEVCLFILGMPG